MNKPILVVRPGWITANVKGQMTKAGYLVIEAPEGEEVKVIQPVPVSDLVTPDEFTTALLGALSRQISAGKYASDVGWDLLHRLAAIAAKKENRRLRNG